MRLDIRYVTRFRYAGAVSESQNELRACPTTDHRQALVHYHVRTDPASRVAAYRDHWGTRVDTFGIRLPHRHLEVVAEATVETQEPVRPLTPVPLAALQDPTFHDEHLEFLQPSAHVSWGAGVQAEAGRIAAGVGDDVVALAQAVHDHVGGFTYLPGATRIGTPVEEILTARRGVCQDFAHLALALLRSLGVPARYVSGYLFAAADATGSDPGTDEVTVQTHAWVEAAIPGWGWFALDPTNNQHVSERHVTIGRGRDYDDVAPFRGVFVGEQRHELEVEVAMRRFTLSPLGDAGAAGQQQQ
ncbi:MAG: transglutaminase domain-containing protein [Nitriliruptoraceae bacterium]